MYLSLDIIAITPLPPFFRRLTPLVIGYAVLAIAVAVPGTKRG